MRIFCEMSVRNIELIYRRHCFLAMFSEGYFSEVNKLGSIVS